MILKKKYDDEQWKLTVQFANNLFNNGDKFSSVQQYRYAIDIAMKLFFEFKETDPLPSGLTPALVVSYLNLADCWAAQNKKKEQILCLIEIYDFLKKILGDYLISQGLNQQVYDGLNNVYMELCICFKEIDAQEELLKTEEDFIQLSSFYQLKTCVIH